jgi:SAM-dependent methyltransferase
VAPQLRRRQARFGVDLCSGTGFVPRVLLPHLPPEARILCVDVSEQALEQARASTGPNAIQVAIHAGDARRLPVPSAAADWVSINAALHHLSDPGEVLAEIDRVLRPGGLFALGHEPNAAFFHSATASALRSLIWRGFWYGSPVRCWRRVRKAAVAAPEADAVVRINQTLAAEGLAAGPLTADEIHSLVDVHTHHQLGRPAGFVPLDLLCEHLPGYALECLVFSDYGGEMLRPHRVTRAALDATLSLVLRGRGQLFSWIVRKPDAGDPA